MDGQSMVQGETRVGQLVPPFSLAFSRFLSSQKDFVGDSQRRVNMKSVFSRAFSRTVE